MDELIGRDGKPRPVAAAFMRFLVNVTEPLLGPLRRMIPRLGWLDISPIVAILILMLFQGAVAGTLLQGAAFHTF